MRIILNGESTEIDEGISAQRLIETLGLSGKRFALEVNEQVLPRSQHALCHLKAGDRVEIVNAIGGG